MIEQALFALILVTSGVLLELLGRPSSANGRLFFQVCGGPALSLFRHEELELLVCGLPHFDFDVSRAPLPSLLSAVWGLFWTKCCFFTLLSLFRFL
jgi:hypothetical protein